MKFAIACLLGLASASTAEPVWSLRSVNDHKTDSEVQKAYGDHSVKQANGRDPYDSTLAQVDSESSDSDSSDDDAANVQLDKWYTTFDEDKNVSDHGYKRVTSTRFAADTDDIFMRSMIQNYAIEEGDCDKDADGKEINCKPSGRFWMNASGARAAAAEVLNTHKGLSGGALQKYLDTYFQKAWNHFDVNRTGAIEVIKMPQFMRFIASDQSLSLGESG